MSPEAELKKLMMRRPRLTLAVAESLTCGHVSARIGAVSGASGYYLGGITAYTLEQKVKLLGVNRAQARRANCVSQRVAVEMAAGARELFGADLAVATTGYAEPSLRVGAKIPQAWWALCHRKRGGRMVTISGFLEMPRATRVQAQERVTTEVLEKLAAYLREIRSWSRPGGCPHFGASAERWNS